MLRQTPRVYSMEPSPKPTSGQRPPPRRLSKSTTMRPLDRSTRVMFAVSAQLPRSGGLFQITAFRMSNGTSVNCAADVYGLTSVLCGSVARTRQKYVPEARSTVEVQDVVPCCCSATGGLVTRMFENVDVSETWNS